MAASEGIPLWDSVLFRFVGRYTELLVMDEPKSEVFNMDCMEGMRGFPDKYFELAIVDPPYGISASKVTHYSNSKIKFTKYQSKKWDESIPDQAYFDELFRVSKKQVIWGGNYFQLPLVKSWVIWDKRQPEGNDFSMFEMAWTSTSIKPMIFYLTASYNNGGCGTDRQFKESKARIHPTQKPITLYKWLLKNYAKPGDKILDTHLGSGSSRIAAYEMGFDFTGYELDKDYFDASCKRFEQYKSQLKLFFNHA